MTHLRLAGGMALPQHHPSAETLASYVAGTMRAGFDVVVAAHLQNCAACSKHIADLERLGGHLISEIAPVAMSQDALNETLSRLEVTPHSPSGKAESGLDQLLSGARRRWVAPGVWSARVDTPHHYDDRVFLLRVAPGANTAQHTHAGAEFTQILEGALNDNGVIYHAGDFVELSEDHTHQPRPHGDEPCLCLFATEGRLVPTDIIGRIAFTIANV